MKYKWLAKSLNLLSLIATAPFFIFGVAAIYVGMAIKMSGAFFITSAIWLRGYRDEAKQVWSEITF